MSIGPLYSIASACAHGALTGRLMNRCNQLWHRAPALDIKWLPDLDCQLKGFRWLAFHDKACQQASLTAGQRIRSPYALQLPGTAGREQTRELNRCAWSHIKRCSVSLGTSKQYSCTHQTWFQHNAVILALWMSLEVGRLSARVGEGYDARSSMRGSWGSCAPGAVTTPESQTSRTARAAGSLRPLWVS